MSVNLNSDGGQRVEGQQSTENADDEEKSGEQHFVVAELDRNKEHEGADKAPHASEDEDITPNLSMKIPILKDTINDGTIYSSIEGGVSCTLVHLVKLLASNTYAFKNLKMDPLSAVEKMRSLLAKVLHGEVYKKTSDSDKPMSSLLVEECITHLIQSTQQGKKATKVFESLHPYYQQSSYGGSVGFSEARALRVTFNLQCSTQGRDASALKFYLDENCTHEIASFSGTAGWRPFIVEAGKVYFKFLSRANEGNHWGYKFEVAPISGLQWVNEKEVVNEASLEWACYVLDFLLKEGLELGIGAAVHKPEIFNALVQYLCFPGVPYKRKVVSLLLQLLQSPSLFPTKPDLDSLKGVGSLVAERCKSTRNYSDVMAPTAIQALVELEATRRKVEEYFSSNKSELEAYSDTNSKTQLGDESLQKKRRWNFF